ncbi:hypothetical protein IEU95_04065 [Hoyosella rhizosphaerae]|uniref:Rv3235 family protein n=1 Tax=Hoyosella rhizosphaerae TaxID=1755582 RepID=UPI00166DB6CE|nr:Rv3235 family protein [Hoyosella rhizosphaerae]MBN4925989.1 hypothetical protein [Hoyosella rhizosphaerae]
MSCTSPRFAALLRTPNYEPRPGLTKSGVPRPCRARSESPAGATENSFGHRLARHRRNTPSPHEQALVVTTATFRLVADVLDKRRNANSLSRFVTAPVMRSLAVHADALPRPAADTPLSRLIRAHCRHVSATACESFGTVSRNGRICAIAARFEKDPKSGNVWLCTEIALG